MNPANVSRRPFLAVAILILCLGLFVLALPVAAGESSSLDGVGFSAKGYFDSSNGTKPEPGGQETDYNRFALTRGYFTFRKEIDEKMSFRLTMDLHQDDSGDYKRREKYYYAELRPDDVGVFTDLKAEIGMGHMPWLDFEEHINPYRCQGTMAIERAGTFNSADLGVSLRGYFGGKLDRAGKRTGNKNYAGRWGSWHVGVYNGPGYHAEEANENKLIEGRLTFRPLADILPGLQISGLGIRGEGNSEITDANGKSGSPDYAVDLGMVSYEHPLFTLTGQMWNTEGNAGGGWVDSTGTRVLETDGYSLFGDFKLAGAKGRWNLFGRLDHFDADSEDIIADDTSYNLLIGGLVYHLHGDNLIMLVLEQTDYDNNFVGKKKTPSYGRTNLGDDSKVQIVYQIKL